MLKIIAGPCVIYDHVFEIAGALKDITVGVEWYFKASFDKANRTSCDSYRGPGFANGIGILSKIRESGIKTTTDFHEAWQIEASAHQVDIVQIPAFLCRQTDLLLAAKASGRVVNVKKGQFISPANICEIRRKVGSCLITERGSQFGYGDLVVDFRNLALCDVLDVTHSVSNWKDSLNLGKAGIACGIEWIFCEVGSVGCDEKRSIPLNEFPGILKEWRYLYSCVHGIA